MKVFVDTGAFCALTIPADSWHTEAMHILALLRKTRARIYTSNFVLSEICTLLNTRASHRAAVALMDSHKQGGVNTLRITEQTETDAEALFKKLDFPRLSFTDCTSFVLINTHAIDHVFTFDTHFNMFRFKHPVVILGAQS